MFLHLPWYASRQAPGATSPSEIGAVTINAGLPDERTRRRETMDANCLCKLLGENLFYHSHKTIQAGHTFLAPLLSYVKSGASSWHHEDLIANYEKLF